MKKEFVCKPNGDGYKELHQHMVDNEHKDMTYYAVEGRPKKRSLDSNALQAVWIREVSEHTGESIKYVRATVKRDLGLPIVRHEAETPEEQSLAKMLNRTLENISYDFMSPKQQLNAMTMFSVTSAMSRRQHKKMLDDMVMHYASVANIVLTNGQ